MSETAGGKQGGKPRRGQPWMVVTGRVLADVTTPNFISLLFLMLLVRVKAIATPCGCYPQCCQGQAPAPFCVDILTTMSTDCQTKMRGQARG